VLIALHPARFGGVESFAAGVEAVAAAVTEVEPAPGVDRVKLPGEPEAETEARRRSEGIPVPDPTWEELRAVAASLGVA
jgi:LDH2 family malate/lactate/ureidoglycolate dehydrogenase